MSILAHFDEGHEKIQHPVTQLLHVSMLIGRAFIPVNGDALMNDLAIEIFLLAERFHHQLLQIFTEQHEAIFVRQHYHVFLASAVSDVKPHQREQHRCILPRIVYAGQLVHRRRAGKKIVDVETFQSHGHEPDRAHDRCPTADPVMHRKSDEPTVFLCVLIQLAPDTGHRHGMFSEFKFMRVESRCRFEHPVARFLRAAGFRNYDHKRLGKVIVDLGQDAIESVRIGIVEKGDVHRIMR